VNTTTPTPRSTGKKSHPIHDDTTERHLEGSMAELYPERDTDSVVELSPGVSSRTDEVCVLGGGTWSPASRAGDQPDHRAAARAAVVDDGAQ
jgi:hypothetical protein